MKRSIEDILDLETLAETYSYANTPSYLYKHFRRNDTVAALSSEYTPDELVEGFNRAMAEKNPHAGILVVIYSIIMAMTLKEYSQVKSFFDELRECALPWAKELSNIFLSSATIAQGFDRNERYRLDAQYAIGTKQSSDVDIQVSHEPLMKVEGGPID